jgi:hypothetical protein
MTFLEELQICLAGSNDGRLVMVRSDPKVTVTFKEKREHRMSVFTLLSPRP